MDSLAFIGRSQGIRTRLRNIGFALSGAALAAVVPPAVLLLQEHRAPNADVNTVMMDADEFDFGDVPANSKVTHEFRLTNTGDTAIEIVGTRSTCSCSTADGIQGQTVAAGGTMPIPISIRVAEDEGEQFGDVTIPYKPSADEGVRSRTVRVLANPKPDYRILPRSRFLDLGVITLREPKWAVVTLEPLLEPGSRLLTAVPNDRRIQAAVAADRLSATIRCDGRISGNSGRIAGLVVLASTSVRQAKVLVAVQGEFQAAVNAEPTAVTVAANETGILERDIVLRIRDRTLTLQSVDCTDKAVGVSAGTPDPDGTRRLRVVLPAVAADLAADIQVVFVGPASEAPRREERIVIPVYRFARRPQEEVRR